MEIDFRKANKTDIDRCAEIRGLTRDNPISREVLEAIGVTEELWAPKIDNGTFEGFVVEDKESVVGYCYGDTQTGEILVLALLRDYENIGAGRKLLSLMVARLQSLGHTELWLAASPNEKIRAHGFYRHLGWQATQTYDENDDEILKYKQI
jgi:ribosomal protein S18 acetylase RimI-like enzyme